MTNTFIRTSTIVLMLRKGDGRLTIDPDKVHETLGDCMFKQEEVEVVDGQQKPKNPDLMIVVEGIMNKFGVHKERLEKHRKQIEEWLDELPMEFHQHGGGGWSFLNACNDRNGEQWTGFHQRMEELFVLGIAIGRAKWQMPREMWPMFPGGMPYVVITSKPMEEMDKKTIERTIGWFKEKVEKCKEELEEAPEGDKRAVIKARLDMNTSMLVTYEDYYAEKFKGVECPDYVPKKDAN